MIYFTSDLHFWHARIIEYCNRPYASVEEMNEKLLLNYNEVVKPEDTCYILGDFAMAFRSVELYTPRMNGRKLLVPGNHDFCHPAHKKGRKDQIGWSQKYIDHGFAEVLPLTSKLELAPGLEVVLSHMPYVGDHSEYEANIRYPQYRPKDEGLWLLHGHTHNAWREKGRNIDVGVDARDYKPVSLQDIVAIIEKSKEINNKA